MSTNDGTSQTDNVSTAPSGEGTDPRIAALETELAAARQRLEESERRAQIQRILIEAGTIDVEAATLLVESALREDGPGGPGGGGKPGTVPRAVAELKRRKPVLFRHPPRPQPGGSGVMGGAPIRAGAEAEHAARQAAQTGDRRALLHYMRLRRAAS